MSYTNDPASAGSLVVGLFKDRAKAEQAIAELRSAGFQDRQIDATQAEDVNRGSGTGSSSGGGFMQALGRLFTGGSENQGNLYNTLRDMGLAEGQARYFESRFGNNDELVTVHANGRTADAIAIFSRYGADTGTSATTAVRETVVDAPATTTATTGTLPVAGAVVDQPVVGTTDRFDNTPQRLELREERLQVNKERVQVGEVDIRKEVISETQSVDVPTVREELIVERRTVEPREATNADFTETKEIRVPLTEERVTTDKRAVVTEEVLIDKRQIQETERVSETVRREDVVVDREGQVNVVEGDTTTRRNTNDPDTSNRDRRID